MKITHHGGGCCGIKQICYLGFSPDEMLYAYDAAEDLHAAKQYANTDARGGPVSSDRNIYWFARPAEKAGERFDAYLDFLRKHRPCSLVEVTIVPYEETARYDDVEYCSEYQASWAPFLKKRGFSRVARVANSNSGNHVEVYHLVLEDVNWDYDSYYYSYFDVEEEDEDEICPEYGGD
jgi:hypothetical protein